MHEVAAHERINEKAINDAIRTSGDEFIIVRRPFRWMKNGVVIPNAYEHFDMIQVCSENNWVIVQAYGDSIAICKKYRRVLKK